MPCEKKQVAAVILDWAGTSVDFGCFAPLCVLLDIFAEEGLNIQTADAREPMGLAKKEHIRKILEMEHVAKEFKKNNGRDFNENDVLRLYNKFAPALVNIIENYSSPIEGVVDTILQLRSYGIKIGSTTGYTKEMMNILVPAAGEKGYSPDYCVTPDDVSRGRPYPYMIFKNMEHLGVFPPCAVIKARDTLSDIREGKNAGVWSIGIITGSSELGLSAEEIKSMPTEALALKKLVAERRFYKAGADFVIDSISELPSLIETVNERLSGC